MQRFLASQFTSSPNVITRKIDSSISACRVTTVCVRHLFALLWFHSFRSLYASVQQSCDQSLEIPWLTCFDALKLPGIRLFISTQHIPMQSPRLDTFVATVEPPKKLVLKKMVNVTAVKVVWTHFYYTPTSCGPQLPLKSQSPESRLLVVWKVLLAGVKICSQSMS
jgi:hypothetical protein